MAAAQKAKDKGRKLASHVHIDGQVYGPGSDVPAEVAERITNPKAWLESEAVAADEADADGDN